MNYIVFDLEATCSLERDIEQEIIEIGAVKVDERGVVVDEFSAFVRPVIHPVLTPFATELTSITQPDVDFACPFPVVIKEFQKWIGLGSEPYTLCSWGYYDKTQLIHDCVHHGMDAQWVNSHISLKHQHQRIRGVGKLLGLKKALRVEGFDFEGTAHRGIDDARNTAKIFTKHLGKWEL